MKRPKLPNNLNYWLHTIKDPDIVKAYMERGNAYQKRNLKRALLYVKWQKIQEKKRLKEERKRKKNEII